MLTLDPGTMAGMTDEHLLSSLHGEHLTPCERELLKRWECALRDLDIRKRVDEIEPHIAEAMASYPPEDFLSDILYDLQELSGNVRGANKDKCLELLEDLDDRAQCIHNQSEYGRSELKEILNASKS